MVKLEATRISKKCFPLKKYLIYSELLLSKYFT